VAAPLGRELGLRHHGRQRNNSAFSVPHHLSHSSVRGGSKHRVSGQRDALSSRLRRSDWNQMVKIRVVDIDSHCVANRFRAYLDPDRDFSIKNSAAPASCGLNPLPGFESGFIFNVLRHSLVSAQSTMKGIKFPEVSLQHLDDQDINHGLEVISGTSRNRLLMVGQY